MGCGSPDTRQEWFNKATRDIDPMFKSYELICVATNEEGQPALQIRALYEGGYYNIYSEDGTDYLYSGTIKASDKDLLKRGYSKLRKDMPANNATQPLTGDGLIQGRTLKEWMGIGFANSYLPSSEHIHPDLFENEALRQAFVNSWSMQETIEMLGAMSKGEQPSLHTKQPMLPGFEDKSQEFDADNMILAGLRDAPTTDVDPFLPTDEDDSGAFVGV